MNFSFNCVKSSGSFSVSDIYPYGKMLVILTLLLRVLFNQLDQLRANSQRLMVQFLPLC